MSTRTITARALLVNLTVIAMLVIMIAAVGYTAREDTVFHIFILEDSQASTCNTLEGGDDDCWEMMAHEYELTVHAGADALELRFRSVATGLWDHRLITPIVDVRIREEQR